MGSYTSVNLVRSATGLSVANAPSYTVNFAIQRGEAAMKKYLGVTPASNNVTGTNMWCRDAATSFAAHYLFMRLASQNAPAVQYARGTRTAGGGQGGSAFQGYGIMGESWWNDGIRICDMHGRDIIIQRVEP